jgi:hypothetical protein
LVQRRSGAERQGYLIEFGKAHAFWQDDAGSVEERGLCGIGLGDAAQTDVAMGCGWQDDIVGLDAGEVTARTVS